MSEILEKMWNERKTTIADRYMDNIEDCLYGRKFGTGSHDLKVARETDYVLDAAWHCFEYILYLRDVAFPKTNKVCDALNLAEASLHLFCEDTLDRQGEEKLVEQIEWRKEREEDYFERYAAQVEEDERLKAFRESFVEKYGRF